MPSTTHCAVYTVCKVNERGENSRASTPALGNIGRATSCQCAFSHRNVLRVLWCFMQDEPIYADLISVFVSQSRNTRRTLRNNHSLVTAVFH